MAGSMIFLMCFFVDHLRRHKPPPIFKPQFALFALNHTGIAVPNAAHIGGAAADVLDLVDFVDLPFIKNNLQGSQSSLGAEAHIDFHIALFSLNHLRCLLCRMKIPDQVDVVVVVGVDAAQNRVCVHDRTLYTAVTVSLAQGVHGFVDVLQLLALFLVGKKS